MGADTRKITISLPADILEFADAEAGRWGISRSLVIAEALTRLARLDAEEGVAADGYRYYAAEAIEFASGIGSGVAAGT